MQVPQLYDEPKWAILTPELENGVRYHGNLRDNRRLFMFVKCPDWLTSPEAGCQARSEMFYYSLVCG